jgi:hypothetical protein
LEVTVVASLAGDTGLDPHARVTHNTAGVRRDALLHRGNRREIINREDWPMHKLYSVNADVDTGHWLDTPEPLGKVSLAEFDKLSDTPDATCTTFEISGRKTHSNSGSHPEGKGYGEPLQASIAVSDLNL